MPGHKLYLDAHVRKHCVCDVDRASEILLQTGHDQRVSERARFMGKRALTGSGRRYLEIRGGYKRKGKGLFPFALHRSHEQLGYILTFWLPNLFTAPILNSVV